jgi:hypothetical protein
MVVRLSALHIASLYPSKISGTHFCQRISQPQGHSADGRIRSIEKSNDLFRNQTCDLLACNIVPQPTMLPTVCVSLKKWELLPESLRNLKNYDFVLNNKKGTIKVGINFADKRRSLRQYSSLAD